MCVRFSPRGDWMKFSSRLVGSVCAAALLLAPFSLCAQDNKSTPKPASPEKSESPIPSTTHGAVTVGGQNIDYTAVAGIITVGATDIQDAQLGLDGKPLPGSQLALSVPKDPADAPPVAQMFYVAYFKIGARAADRPVAFFYNGGPGSSTMWLHLGSVDPSMLKPQETRTSPALPTSLSTILTACSMPATWSSSICREPALAGLPARMRAKPSGASIRTRGLLPVLSPASLPSTAAGTRQNFFLAKATNHALRRAGRSAGQ